LFLRSKFIRRSCGKLKLKCEPKDTVDVLQEIKKILYLILNLVQGAEYVTIILLESSHSCKTCESTRDLISVKHAKISDLEWQVSVSS
jgi:hypothetical protein